jgi:hypothetical protein
MVYRHGQFAHFYTVFHYHTILAAVRLESKDYLIPFIVDCVGDYCTADGAALSVKLVQPPIRLFDCYIPDSK